MIRRKAINEILSKSRMIESSNKEQTMNLNKDETILLSHMRLELTVYNGSWKFEVEERRANRSENGKRSLQRH